MYGVVSSAEVVLNHRVAVSIFASCSSLHLCTHIMAFLMTRSCIKDSALLGSPRLTIFRPLSRTLQRRSLHVSVQICALARPSYVSTPARLSSSTLVLFLDIFIVEICDGVADGTTSHTIRPTQEVHGVHLVIRASVMASSEVLQWPYQTFLSVIHDNRTCSC